MLDLAPWVELADLDTPGASLTDLLVDTFADRVDWYRDELTGAAAAVDLERFRTVAHTLKGSAATLGLSRLSSVCGHVVRSDDGTLGADGRHTLEVHAATILGEVETGLEALLRARDRGELGSTG